MKQVRIVALAIMHQHQQQRLTFFWLLQKVLRCWARYYNCQLARCPPVLLCDLTAGTAPESWLLVPGHHLLLVHQHTPLPGPGHHK